MFEKMKYDLKYNRKHLFRYVTMWALFSAIIVVFILWGLSPRTQGNGLTSEGGAAATVNDATISFAQFSDTLENMRQDPRFAQLQALGGDAARQILQQQALYQLIEMELINQAAEKQHIMTGDTEVRDAIMGIPVFQENGQFSLNLYKAYLNSTRKTNTEFEDGVRRQLTLRRLLKTFTPALKPLPMEAEKTKELQNMKANLEFVAVPLDSLILPESIGAAEIKTFLAKGDSEGKIKDYFNTHKNDFSSPEKVKVRHILIRAANGDPEAEKKARQKIEDLAKQAKTTPFETLASQNSEDPGSKANGGLIDFFARGKMVPEFEKAAFSQAVNEIGQPVKTEYGFHLIQVLDKKAATTRSMDEVRDEIASILLSKEQTKTAIDALQEDLKKADSQAIQKFITANKLKWEETGSFSIDSPAVPKVGANDEILKAAFQLNAKTPYPGALFKEGSRGYIVRFKAMAAEKPNDKSKAAGELNDEMKNARRTEEVISKWLKELRKNATIVTSPKLAGPQQINSEG